MTAALRSAFLMLLALTVVTGVAYPLIVTALCQTFLPDQADGSLLARGDRVIGSDLIGQYFTSPRYFHGRPSAAGAGYDGRASGGSNLGPLNSGLVRRIDSIARVLSEENPGIPVPVDLVTASGSGLDPHITPAAAMFQVPRVARERGLTEDALRELIHDQTEGRQLGFLGEPRVNVLRLNLALDAIRTN